MKKINRSLASFFICPVFLIIAGCSSINEEEKSPPERLASVRVVESERGDIASYICATGTLVPRRKARLGPKVEGRIERIYVDEGSFVKKGEALIKLEQDTYLILVKEAEAALKTALAGSEKTSINLKNITKDYRRLSKLWHEKAISEQRYDSINTEYTAARAELKLSQAQVKEGNANLDMAKRNLKDTITFAPFSGFIVEKLMEEGEVSNWVTYQWNVLHLVDISTIKIECPIAETKLPFLVLGKEVEIEVDAYPQNIFSGKITTINPKVDPQSRTSIIKIEIPNKNFKLKPGMFTRVKIAEKEKKGVIKIPRQAILVQGESHIVFKILENQARVQKVQLGISDGKLVEVVEGLKEKELIVIEGYYALKEGTKVKAFQ